ncbi:hypothetical protein BGZ83_007509 [Gryganskiella cystojenkinii]|nr:hypothetical protein BGZ83_007509 [Gryganskiella cystojenkinii]
MSDEQPIACLMHAAYLERTYVKNIGHFEISCDRILYLKDELCLSEGEETETLEAVRAVLARIQKNLIFQFLKVCKLMQIDLKSGKKVVVAVHDDYWAEWWVLECERLEKWNLEMDEKDRLEAEAEERECQEKGIKYIPLVDALGGQTGQCLMRNTYLARTYIKKIGHFTISCDRYIYLKRETHLSDLEEKEVMDVFQDTLKCLQKHFFFMTLKKIQLVQVLTKSQKIVFVQVAPEYWQAEEERVRALENEDESQESVLREQDVEEIVKTLDLASIHESKEE